MKRSFPEGGDQQLDSLSMANCLILLSQARDSFDHHHHDNHDRHDHHHHDYHVQSIINNANNMMMTTSTNRVFECKTCNRQFPSFQALGGHRASHKKPRLAEGGGGGNSDTTSLQVPTKPKTHECSICGLEFAIGQALGGHMRRHRAGNNNNNTIKLEKKYEKDSVSLSIASSDHDTTPVLKKSGNGGISRRVLCLDLNLTPYENDLKEFNYKIGNKAASTRMVDCFL